jgi:hypothetical protein
MESWLKSAIAVASDVTLAVTITVAKIYGWRVGLNLPLPLPVTSFLPLPLPGMSLLPLPLPLLLPKFDNSVAGEVGQYYCSHPNFAVERELKNLPIPLPVVLAIVIAYPDVQLAIDKILAWQSS